MTVVTNPISEVWTTGHGVKAVHGALKTLAYAANASSAKYASFAFIFSECDLRAYSGPACTFGFATHVETRSPPDFIIPRFNPSMHIVIKEFHLS